MCETTDRPNRTLGAAGSDVAQLRGGPMRDIGWAVKQMWSGQKVGRRGWNGRNMHIALQLPDQHSKMSQPYVYMKTADGALVPWLASQTDLLATDWEFVEAF